VLEEHIRNRHLKSNVAENARHPSTECEFQFSSGYCVASRHLGLDNGTLHPCTFLVLRALFRIGQVVG
jgi:hypothetical protein